MNIDSEFYDKLGKQLFTDLLKQYNIPFTLTTYQYDKVDIYFGRSAVGEIKYRRKSYPSYIIEENKVTALSSIPCSRQYYITVTDSDIYLWSIPTIRNFQPQVKILPTNLEKTEQTFKTIRFLPVIDADFHFQKKDNKWKLVKFE